MAIKRQQKLATPPSHGAGTLTATEYLIMHLLVENGGKEMYGLELVEQSKGKLKKGTVYVLLSRLEEKGLLKARVELVESAAIARRLYKPTAPGYKVFTAWRGVAEVGGLRGVTV